MESRPNADGKLVGLEALRFLAAFSVLVWHYQHFLFVGDAAVGLVREAQPFYAVLAPLYAYGNAGVELFWCISGFIFAWKYADAIRRRAVSLGRFMMLRFSRLYPLHLVSLLLVAALNAVYFSRHGVNFVYAFYDLKHFLLNLVFASYWGFQGGYSFNGPSWSVSAEILVYVLFFGLSRVIANTLVSAIAITVAVSVLAALLRAWFGIKLSIFGAATFFYLGVITSHLHAWLDSAPAPRRRLGVLACGAAVCVPGLLVFAGVLKVAGASLVMFPALILLFQLLVPCSSARLNRVLGTVGDLTYASYMLHFPLQLAVVLTFEALGIPLASLFPRSGFFLAYIALVFGVAFAVSRWFERPAQNALRSLGRRGERGSVVAAR